MIWSFQPFSQYSVFSPSFLHTVIVFSTDYPAFYPLAPPLHHLLPPPLYHSTPARIYHFILNPPGANSTFYRCDKLSTLIQYLYLFIYLSSISCILIGLDCLCTGHEVWLNLALILSFLIYLYILIYLSLLIYLSILIYILIHFFCYNLSFYSNSSFYPHLSFYPNLVKLFTLCKSIKYTLVLL